MSANFGGCLWDKVISFSEVNSAFIWEQVWQRREFNEKGWLLRILQQLPTIYFFWKLKVWSAKHCNENCSLSLYDQDMTDNYNSKYVCAQVWLLRTRESQRVTYHCLCVLPSFAWFHLIASPWRGLRKTAQTWQLSISTKKYASSTITSTQSLFSVLFV